MVLRSAALIEGLRLEGPLQVGGVRVEQVAYERGFAGRELRETFNALLAEHRFVSAFDASAWGVQLATRRRLGFAVMPPIDVDDVVRASMHAGWAMGQLVDALALTHGGTPKMFAMVNERSDDGHTWQPFVLMAGGGPWSGSALERLQTDSEGIIEVQPLDIWTRAMNDPVLELWLSLYRGIGTEPRPDVRLFRCCSLLEAIGREQIERSTPVADPAGQRLMDHAHQPATARQLRGVMYLLVSRALEVLQLSPQAIVCHPSRTLWNEAGVWADVRNMVGHEGLWRPPALPSTLAGAQSRSAAAFELAGRGDGLDAGLQRYAAAAAAATEAVLRAAVVEPPARRPA